MKVPIPLANLNDKKFSYLIYSWLALPDNSRLSKDKKYRYFILEELNKSKISKETSLSRPTTNTKLKYMLNYCDNIKIEGNYIRLYKTAPYVLIDEDILRLLVKEVEENTLRFYLTLVKYQKYAKNGKLFVRLERIAEEVGLSTTNLDKVAEHHKILSEKGFIFVDQKRFSGIKTQNFYTIFNYDQVLVNRNEFNIEKSKNEEDIEERHSEVVVIKMAPISNDNQKKNRNLEPIDMGSLLL